MKDTQLIFDGKSYKGRFRPKNPGKYNGNPTKIIYRSLLELKVMTRFDSDPQIISWGSEEIIVPYRCATDGKIHRYFPDFVAKIKDKSGKIITYMIEVKPFRQTQKPVKKKQRKQTLMTEQMTYAKNLSKWKAAEEYCADRKWQFKILTEKDIYG